VFCEEFHFVVAVEFNFESDTAPAVGYDIVGIDVFTSPCSIKSCHTFVLCPA